MTDKIAAPPPEAVEAVPAAPAEAPPSPMALAPPSAPYRSGVAAELPELAPAPKERPVLGLSLWVFGVAMWSFVVMGELVTSYGPGKRDFLVSEGGAELFVFAVTLGAWGVALRASLRSTPARSTARAVLRGAGVALLAFLFWGFVTLFAAATGASSRENLDGKITVILALTAGLAAFAGRRLAALHRHDKTPRERAISRALWVGAALVTIVALAEVLAGD
jgi:hypothetical protein